MRQRASDGTVVGEIDLARPYTVSYRHHAAGNTVYRVTQASAHAGLGQIEFTTDIGDAERLVRETLRHDEWPPGDR